MPEEIEVEEIEVLRLSFRLRLVDGQRISVWVWDEKDWEQARKYADFLAKALEAPP